MSRTYFERLSSLDSVFLGLETQHAAMHVGLVGIFEGPPLRREGGRVDVEAIKCATDGALPDIPRYRQKLRYTPLEKQPIWVDDDHFDIDNHVLHAAVPQPGTEFGFRGVVASIVERPLDRHRPLWEIWVVEGLPRDRIALVCKVHHCMIDGVSGVELMGRLLSADPNAGAPASRPFIPRRAPGSGALAFEDYRRRFGMYWHAWQDATHRVFGARAQTASTRAVKTVSRVPTVPSADPHGTMLRPASATPFNRPIGARRRLSWLATEIADIERIRFAFGCSLNDVVLATVTGAVRSYLDLHGLYLRGLDFRVMIPVDIRATDQRETLGNQISAWILRLPLDESDRVKQLQRIVAETQRLKQTSFAGTAELLRQIGEWLPPQVVGFGARKLAGLRPFNMVVTNVPGPPIPLYMRGAKLLEGFPIVPLADHLGLGVALLSYDGKLNWGVNGDYDLVPDLELFVELIGDSFEGLQIASARKTQRSQATVAAPQPSR